MAYSYSAASGPRKEVYLVVQRLFSGHINKRILSALRVLADDGDARKLAIEALQHDDTDPDTQEWAERYLCGMAGADATKFMTNRRAQS